VERVEIRWPSGQTTTLTDPALGVSHRVVEPSVTKDAGPNPTSQGARSR
jgi:hypothetical protein